MHRGPARLDASVVEALAVVAAAAAAVAATGSGSSKGCTWKTSRVKVWDAKCPPVAAFCDFQAPHQMQRLSASCLWRPKIALDLDLKRLHSSQSRARALW